MGATVGDIESWVERIAELAHEESALIAKEADAFYGTVDELADLREFDTLRVVAARTESLLRLLSSATFPGAERAVGHLGSARTRCRRALRSASAAEVRAEEAADTKTVAELVFEALVALGRARTGMLAERLGREPSNISRALTKLIEEGRARRVEGEFDRRHHWFEPIRTAA